jgi:hypothetical protein
VRPRKLAGPALGPEALGPVDCVPLGHDQHPDNLDRVGRASLANATIVALRFGDWARF